MTTEKISGLQIPTMTADETVEAMRKLGLSMGKEKLYVGAEQGIYPFADCVSLKGRSITIYTKLFEQWVMERAVQRNEK